jgi:guanylate kinase
VSIFVLPPSRAELEKRLQRRSESEKRVETGARQRSDEERNRIIQKRLQTAAKEIENYPTYDYILVNDQLEQSIDRLKAIVLAERLKRSGKELSPADRQVLQVAESCLLPKVREKVHEILDSFTASSHSHGSG